MPRWFRFVLAKSRRTPRAVAKPQATPGWRQRRSHGLPLPTEPSIPRFNPALIAHTWRAPENVGRIHRSLDLEQALVVAAPERVLPVLLKRQRLRHAEVSRQHIYPLRRRFSVRLNVPRLDRRLPLA